MKLIDLADQTFRELDSPDDSSLASISFWFKSNVGNLNTLLTTTFYVSNSSEIVSLQDNTEVEIPDVEGNIYKIMYQVYWLNKQVRKHLGSSAIQSVISVDSDGASVRTTNKTTLASEFRNLAKDQQLLLDKLVTTYGINRTIPVQVAGDDTIPARLRAFNCARTRWCP